MGVAGMMLNSNRPFRHALRVAPVRIWWFPKIGVSPFIIHFHAVVHYKASILDYPHDYGKPHRYFVINPHSSQYNPMVNPFIWWLSEKHEPLVFQGFHLSPSFARESHGPNPYIWWLIPIESLYLMVNLSRIPWLIPIFHGLIPNL